MKHALILDLDNTIYPVSSIAENVFSGIFELIRRSSDEISPEDQQAAKYDLTRRPFHLVADKYNFSDDIKQYGNYTLKNMEYGLPMQVFDDYDSIRLLPHKKFLVTTGFKKFQLSKIKMLRIEADFEEIHIVDPELSTQTKYNVFEDIIKRHGFNPADLLVIGDDPESEIKAAIELGIETFLFDPENRYPEMLVTFRSDKLKDVLNYL